MARERIEYYGGRLPDFIAWTKSSPDSSPDANAVYKAIQAKLKELLPALDDIHVTQVAPDRQGLALSFKGHSGYIAAPELSDGTLLTLGLLAIANGPRKPALLCIEEPETGLHPRRLRWLFDQFIELAYPKSGQPRVQVMLTTHSPDLVDFFSDMVDSVLVVHVLEGKSRVRSLSDILAQLKEPKRKSSISIGHAWATGLYEGV